MVKQFDPGDAVMNVRRNIRVLVVKKSRAFESGRRGFEGFELRRGYPEGYDVVIEQGVEPKRTWGFSQEVGRVLSRSAQVNNLRSLNLTPEERDELL